MSLVALIYAMNDSLRKEEARQSVRTVKYKRTLNTCSVALVDGVRKADANYATVAELRSLGIEYREAIKIVRNRPYKDIHDLTVRSCKREDVKERYALILYVGSCCIDLPSE